MVSNLELNARKKLKDLGVNTLVSLPLAGQKYCPLRLLIREDTVEGPDTQACSNVIFKYNLTETKVYIKFLTRDTIAGFLVMDFFVESLEELNEPNQETATFELNSEKLLLTAFVDWVFTDNWLEHKGFLDYLNKLKLEKEYNIVIIDWPEHRVAKEKLIDCKSYMLIIEEEDLGYASLQERKRRLRPLLGIEEEIDFWKKD